MKSKIIKRFASFLAFLMLVTQISIPVYATTGACSGHEGVNCEAGAQDSGKVICNDGWTESSVDYTSIEDECDDDISTGGSGGDDSVSTGGSGGDDAVLSEEVDETNVVEVVSEDVEDATDATGEDLVDQAVAEVLESLEGESTDKVADAVEEIEEDIQEEIADIEDEINENPRLRLKLHKKIAHLKALLAKLRVKMLIKHKNLIQKIVRVKHSPKVYEIRWGDLSGKRQHCPGLTLKDLRTALVDKEIPEKCEKADPVNYNGKISVDRGELKVRKNVLFEKEDSVTTASGSTIAFDSTIAGHWDGLVVQYFPEDTTSADGAKEDLNITISIGDLSKTYTGSEVLGRKQIGNGHHIEIKHLAQVLPSLTKINQNRLIQSKIKVQDKITLLREKLDRLRLMNKGGTGTDELEDLADDIGEYNFDEGTTAEVQTTIDAMIAGLADNASSDDIAAKAKLLREKISAFKATAKVRKFAQKLIPFKDTDDDQWFTNYVSSVKEKGIISGYKDASGNELGEFRPGNNITIAEILKIALETAEKGTESGTPKLAAALNHWAKGYVKKAENLGVDLVEGDVDLNRPATRGEVVRLVLEALGIDPDTITETDFTDVSRAHKHAAFIQYAKELGIVSGDAGKTTFRPNDPVNRAEAAKIADQIMKIIIGGWDS